MMTALQSKKDEKMKKAQSEHKHRQKDQPKKMVQDHFQFKDQQKKRGKLFWWVQPWFGRTTWAWKLEMVERGKG